jgi:ribosomal protein S18 acetylase RimI-like enzyme
MLLIERAADMPLVREMLEEYGRATKVDLSFQDFDHELATLPYEYDPILIAWSDNEAAGCVALRKIDDTICEMKRMYVRPSFRGQDIGRSLAVAIIAEAKQRGFARMRLDTLPAMQSAMSLYESLGFQDIAPYRFNPIKGSRFMELSLGSGL